MLFLGICRGLFSWSRDMWTFMILQGTVKRSGTQKAKPRGRCAVPWGRTERGRRPGACGTTFPYSVDPEISHRHPPDPPGVFFYFTIVRGRGQGDISAQKSLPCRRENDFTAPKARRTSLPRGSQSGPRAPSASGAIRGPRPQAAAYANRLSLHYSYYRGPRCPYKAH